MHGLHIFVHVSLRTTCRYNTPWKRSDHLLSDDVRTLVQEETNAAVCSGELFPDRMKEGGSHWSSEKHTSRKAKAGSSNPVPTSNPVRFPPQPVQEEKGGRGGETRNHTSRHRFLPISDSTQTSQHRWFSNDTDCCTKFQRNSPSYTAGLCQREDRGSNRQPQTEKMGMFSAHVAKKLQQCFEDRTDLAPSFVLSLSFPPFKFRQTVGN